MNVLVTGGHGGIGTYIVNEFMSHGHKVFAPTSSALNLLDTAEITSFVKHSPQIDVFVHCAGINNPLPFLQMNAENIDKTLRVNVLSGLELSQHLIPSMKKNGFGRIVNISSLWSTMTREGRLSYSMSKAALDVLTRNLAAEFSRYNILVNSVVTGFVDTPLTRKNLTEKRLKEVIKNTPTNSLVNADEISSMVYFLCRNENHSITGQSIFVDGGYSILG